MTMKPQHFLFVVFINMAFGFSFVAGKWGVTEMPPVLFTGFRFALLALILVPFLRLYRGQMIWIFLIAQFTGGFHFALMYWGMSLAEDVSAVAIAVQLSVPFTTLLSIIILKEQVGWKRWAGIAVALAGVMVMSFDPRVLGYIEGLLVSIMAGFMYSVAFILMKRLDNVGVFQLQAWIAWFSFPLLLGLSLMLGHDWIAISEQVTAKGWFGVAYTVFGASLIGHAGMYYLVQRYEVSKITALGLMGPVFGIFFGVTVLGDVLTPRMMLGGAMVLGGVLIISLRQIKAPVADKAKEAAHESA